MRLVAVLAWLALALAAACGPSPNPGPHAATPVPHASASAAGETACARLQSRGAQGCPPALTLPQVPVANATGGALADADARRAGDAAVRWYALYAWAANANDAGFLGRGLISEPQAVDGLFGKDLESMTLAQRAGTTFHMDPYRLVDVRVVAIPADLQKVVTAAGGITGPTGVVLHRQGPERETIGDKVTASVPDGVDRSFLLYGHLKDDPDLGAIWYAGGADLCTTANVRSLCG